MNTTADKKQLDWLRLEHPEEFEQMTREFSDLMMVYRCAIREVQTKLEVLNDEFSVRYRRNPIVSIKSRVKKPLSIAKKLQKKGYPHTVDAIKEKLHDVAGVRVTCAFIDDIYQIAGLLANQDDVNVVQIKDYIQNPKPNGYRSFHMIISIPVFFSERVDHVHVEVQIRTIAMDFWASLEHQLRYKKQMTGEKELEVIGKELYECAEVIARTDIRMQNIKEMIGEFYEVD